MVGSTAEILVAALADICAQKKITDLEYTSGETKVVIKLHASAYVGTVKSGPFTSTTNAQIEFASGSK